MNNKNKEKMPKKSNRSMLYGVVVVIIVLIIIGSIYYETISAPSAGTTMTLYVGEITAQAYGFGSSANNLTSNPGPTLTLKSGQTYTLTLHNVGTMQHNWAIVDHKATNANVLWGAATSFTNAGSSGQVTFKAGSAGTYVYICEVPGHIALGLWGTVTVNP